MKRGCSWGRLTRLLWLLAASCGPPLFAETPVDGEFQSWTMATVTWPMGEEERWTGYMEVFPWFADGTGDLRIIHLRPAVGVLLRENVSFWQGYAWTPLIEPSYRNEHRFFQQLLVNHEIFNWVVTHRTRLEERLIQGADGTALRGVHLARIDVPIGDRGKWTFAVLDQVFVNLNSTRGGPQAGFDQNMAFAGVRRIFSERLNMDIGYLNHYINRPNDRDSLNHSLLTIFNLSL